MNYDKWKLDFTKDVIGPLSEECGSARPLKYSEVLEYDRKIRDFKFLHDEKLDANSNSMQYMWPFYKDICKLFIISHFNPTQ